MTTFEQGGASGWRDAPQPGAGRFSGDWSDRLGGLFECGVDFTDKSLLDVGCNIGIISYEISKARPILIHGIDVHVPSIEFARVLFESVSVESKFSHVDLRDPEAVRAEIARQYDVVLYLAVDQHLRKQCAEHADLILSLMFSACSRSFLFRAPPKSTERALDLATSSGFREVYRQQDGGRINPMIRFDRVA